MWPRFHVSEKKNKIHCWLRLTGIGFKEPFNTCILPVWEMWWVHKIVLYEKNCGFVLPLINNKRKCGRSLRSGGSPLGHWYSNCILPEEPLNRGCGFTFELQNLLKLLGRAWRPFLLFRWEMLKKVIKSMLW